MSYMKELRESNPGLDNFSDAEIAQHLPDIDPEMFAGKSADESLQLATQDNNFIADAGRLFWSGAKETTGQALTAVELATGSDWQVDDDLIQSGKDTYQNVDPLLRQDIERSGFQEESENSVSGMAGALAKSGGSMVPYAVAQAGAALTSPFTGGASTLATPAAVNAAVIAGGNYHSVKEQINALPYEQLEGGELFANYLARAGKFAQGNEAKELARVQMADDLARDAATEGAWIGGLSGAVLGPALSKMFRGGQGALKGAGTGAAAEGGQEFVESGAESYAVESAKSEATGSEINYNRVARDAAFGATLGAGAGGSLGAVTGALAPTPIERSQERINEAVAQAAAEGGDSLDQAVAGGKAQAETVAAAVSETKAHAKASSRDMSGLDGLIIVARRQGFSEEEARLTNAKNLYERALQYQQNGDVTAADRLQQKADQIVRDVSAVNEPIKQQAKANFPVPFTHQGIVEGTTDLVPGRESVPESIIEGEAITDPQQLDYQTALLTDQRGVNRLENAGVIYADEPAEVTAARKQREADNFNAFYGQEGQTNYQQDAIEGELDRSNELPDNRVSRLPPGTGQIDLGQQRPAREFKPVDSVYPGVGENIVQRQAGDKSALPRPITISPDQYRELQAIQRQAVRTPVSKRTAEQKQALTVVAEVKTGKIEVVEQPKAQPLTRKKAAKVDTERHSFAQAIALSGGLSRESAQDIGVDPAHFSDKRGGVFGKPLFRKNGGLSEGELFEVLSQQGMEYIRTQEEFRSRLFDHLGGKPHYTAEGYVRQAEEEAALREQFEEGADPVIDGQTSEESILSVAVDEARQAGVAENRIHDILQNNDNELDVALELRNEIDQLQTEGLPAGNGSEGSGRAEEEAGEFPAGESTNPEQVWGSEGFELNSYTETDLSEQEQSIADAEASAAIQEKTAQAKADADSQVNDFTLSGSDRSADVAAARGQNDMFGASADSSRPEGSQKPIEKIDDFGEKLEGARKHTFSFTQAIGRDLDVKAVPLSKSFPQPDYEKLAAAGVDARVLAFVSQLRAELKAKPRAKYKVNRWAETVESARSTSSALMDGTITPDRLIEKLSASERSSYVKYTPVIMEIAAEILPSQIKDLGSYKIEQHHYSIFRGEKDVNKIVVTDASKKGGFGGMGNQQHFNSVDEAKAYIKSQVTTVSETGKPMAKFDIWTERGKEGYFIGKKLSASKYIELHNVPTGKDAREYIQKSNEELVALLKKKKEVRNVRRSENNARVGKDYRQGVDVTADLFAATFGFRGVQFGNWVDNDKRQSDLNNAYDGLMDLANLIDVPPLALSLDGQLGLAFGARGKGGKNPASAHFEPVSIVINLTKKNGAGSLAHEWFHAADNYFGRIDNPEADTPFISTTVRNKHAVKVVDGRQVVAETESSDFAVRQEVFDAFKGLKKAIEQETNLAKRSSELDSRRTKDYWSTVHEMTARSFERYVIGRLNDQGFESDYLANIVSEEEHEQINGILGDNESYAYPLNSEMEAVNKAYDHLFDTIETKETDSGVAMFSRSGAGANISEPSTGNLKPHSGLAVNVVKSAVVNVRKRLALRGVSINVVATESDLPGVILKQAEEDGAQGEIGAVYHDKAIYVVADRMSSVSDVETAIFHEAGHYGGRVLFGKDLMSAYRKLWMKIGGVKRMKALAAEAGLDAEMEPYFETADRGIQDGSLSAAQRAAYLVDEFIAHLNQKQATEKLPAKITRAIKEFVGAVRNALRKFGFTELPEMSQADLAYLLKRINKAGKGETDINDRPFFMRVSEQDEQLLFLNELADEMEIEEQMSKATDTPRFSRQSGAAEAFTDLNEDQTSFLGKIAPKTTTQRIKDRIAEALDRGGLKVRQGMVDRYAALFELDKKAQGEEVVEHNTRMSSWVLAKMSHAADGALSALMSFGRIKFSDGVVQLQNDQDESGGLMGVLSKLGSGVEVERFMGWIAANRSAKLSAEGRENLFTEEEIAAGIDLNKGETAEGKQREALYEEVFAEFQQYRDDVLKIAQESGIISEDNYDMWKDEFYVPFYRVMEEQDTNGPRMSGGLSRQQAYKKLKGGSQELNDLLENTLLNFQHLLSSSLKNNAASQAVDNAVKVGIAEQTSESARDKKASTFVLEGGEKRWYNISDPLVFESLTSLNDPGTSSFSRKMMRSFKRIFTSFITSSPQFMVANGIRDTLHAMAIGNLSYNGFKNFAGGLKDYGSPVHKGKLKGQMMATGASFSFGHVYGSGDADALHAELERTIKGAKVLRNPKDVTGMIRQAWDFYSGFGDSAENSNRTSMYKQNLDKGELYAAFQARDLMDFSSHGAWPAVRFLVDTVPFLNARLIGLDRMYRGGVKPTANVIKQMLGGEEASMTDKQAAQRFAIVTGALTAASIALYLHNKDDEEFQKLEDWQRDMYWYVRVGDSAYFIPKPFEIGAIATVAERGLEQMVDDTKDGKLFLERMGHVVTDTFAFNPVPQMFKPVLDVYANKSSFTGRDIETMGMDRLSKVNRYRAGTTDGARYISQALESTVGQVSQNMVISPVQADYLIQQYLGWVGTMGATTIDIISKQARGHDDPAKDWSEYQPFRRFFKDTSNPGYTRYGTEFYDTIRETNRVYADIKHLRKIGEEAAAAELAAENGSKLRVRSVLNKARKTLSNLNTRSKMIQRNSKLSATEKRQRLDAIQKQRNTIQERIVKRLKVL